MLGDDIVYNQGKPAAKQLTDFYEKTQSTIVGVQEVEYDELNKYGIVKPKNESEDVNCSCEIGDMVEKPNPKDAPSRYAVLGRYVLTPKIFELLEDQEEGIGGEIQLTDAIKRLIEFEKVYAYEFEGERYDVGTKKGFIEATLDFALRREDLKEEVEDLIVKKYKDLIGE